jgi:Carboxypeptidase regulatory-like domain/TonB dependent receptor
MRNPSLFQHIFVKGGQSLSKRRSALILLVTGIRMDGTRKNSAYGIVLRNARHVRGKIASAHVQSKSAKWLVAGILLGICSILSSGRSWAQLDQGTVTGVVEDNAGAVLSGAGVELSNVGMGLKLRTKTDGSGVYSFPPVNVGIYEVSASAAGFETTTQKNVRVNVQGRVNIELKLSPGKVTETVVVSTDPPLLQSQDASVGQVMTSLTVNATPLNGRNWVYIAQLAAGVDPSHGSRAQGDGDFYANGQRVVQNNFIIDGLDNNTYAPDYLNGASYNVQPPPDALAEFKIQTSNYGAQFGHSVGGVVNASIKSGTNQIHGSLWEYLRNDIFDARDFDALVVPKYRQNQFGATLGMPIVRNKAFFFGYTEANRIVFAQTGTYSVPTPLMRTGNFSELLNTGLTQQAKAVTLYQPGSAGTAPINCNGQVNVICPSQIDPVAEGLIDLLPMPNTNNGKTLNNYLATSNSTSNSWQWGARTDWNVSPKDQMFARFSYVHVPQDYVPPLGPIADGGVYGQDGSVVNLNENFAFSETHIFSPAFSSNLRYGYSYGDYQFLQVGANQNISPTLGLGGVPFGPKLGGTPQFSVTSLSSFGTTPYFPAGKHTNEFQIEDDMTGIIGNHTLGFGINLQSVRLNVASSGDSRGVYAYTGKYTGVPGQSFTGAGASDFLLDQMNSASLTTTHPSDLARWYVAGYFQDDWKVRPNLTLNMGLRYDYFQNFKELSLEEANFEMTGAVTPGGGSGIITYPTQKTPLYLAPAFLSFLTQSNVQIQYSNNQTLTQMPKTNFGPRLGIAYMLQHKTVIRGGYGLFFGGLDAQLSYSIISSYPFRFNSSFLAPSACVPGNCQTSGLTLENGFTKQLAVGLVNSVSTPSFTQFGPKLPPTYAQDFNLTVERTIAANISASVGYVASTDRHLGVIYNENGSAALTDPRLSSQLSTPFPVVGSVSHNAVAGISSYNSLQATLQRRSERGLNFLATYTYAHSLDDAPEELGSTGDSGYRAPNLIGISNDYSNSASDVRHRLTFMGLYDLPFGLGQTYLNHGGFTNSVVGGWRTDLTFVAQTGQPFTVGNDLGSAGPNGGSANAILIHNPYAAGGTPPPSNPGISCAQKTRTLAHWYNPCAFANPPLAFPAAGIAGSPVSTVQITGLNALPYLGGVRNNMHGPGYERVNMSLFKTFRIFREQQIEFRADTFNLFNTPAYGSPATANNSSSGGQITSPRVFQNFTPDARFFQLSVKYQF